jgi:hydroxymethylpyrimidine/phosphomethylpyrimidine kinase
VRPPVALTIAGSDSGGGAGIQADLKTFVGVSGFVELSPEIVRAQIDDVVSDLAPSAAKTGMLASAEIIAVVAEAAEAHGLTQLVVDPVMIAKGGAKLLRDDAVEALRARLLPLAAVVTPNLPEAEVLLDRGIATRDERERAAADLVALGCRAAVVKGGHAEGDADDVWFDGIELTWLAGERIATRNTHGSGCAFSAAIAAGLASGRPLHRSLRDAKVFISGAILDALEVGHGHGPVNPMWGVVLWRRE